MGAAARFSDEAFAAVRQPLCPKRLNGFKPLARMTHVVRWLTVLCVLTAVSALLTFGVVPTEAVGLARILLGAYATLLIATVVVALVRG